MKKLTTMICMLLLTALLIPMAVRADVIYEPFDSFYEQHRNECTYVGRSYTTNGPNGTVTLYASPEDAGVKKTYSNGTALYISYSYQAADGVLWACCDNWDDDVTGWAPMAYLDLIYDEQSFYEEHVDKIVPVQIALESSELTGQTVYFWEYPGSPDHIAVELSADYRPSFQESYTDENGTEWIRCGYFMGIRGKWVNLNNPTADFETLFPDLPEETEPAATEPAATEEVTEIKPAGSSIKVTITVAVVAVVVSTAALLVMIKQKKF